MALLPSPLQWLVVRAALDPVRGSEQAGLRPVLVVSAEAGNAVLPVVTVLPLTSRRPGRRIYPTEVLLLPEMAGQPNESIIMAHQIRTLAKERLGSAYGRLENQTLREEVRAALRLHLDLDA